MFNNTFKKLQSESETAINVFQKTVDSLTKTNEKISKERESKIQQIKDLQSEAQALNGLLDTNNKVVSKIQNFLTE